MVICVPGLKIDGDRLYFFNTETRSWEEAPLTLIPLLEELCARFEKIIHPKTSTQENLVIEDQFDAGEVKIKTFKDADGDMQVKLETGSIREIQVDEDAEFHGDNGRHVENLRKSPEPINYWGRTEMKEEETNNINKTNRINKNEPTAHKTVSLDKVINEEDMALLEVKSFSEKLATVQLCERGMNKSKKYGLRAGKKSATSPVPKPVKFNKREVKLVQNKKDELREALKHLLLSVEVSSMEMRLGKKQNQDVAESVCFISARFARPIARIDAGILIGELNYKRRKMVLNTFESKFYLN